MSEKKKIGPSGYFDVSTEHDIKQATKSVEKELRSILLKYPMPYNTSHEFYGVLREEVDELWDEIKTDKKQGSKQRQIDEAIQVAAVALKFIMQNVAK
ncbi:MAG: hypothetical protein ACI9JN_001277 [Bacteroidia bacterium]|jgi:hypothetical protein